MRHLTLPLTLLLAFLPPPAPTGADESVIGIVRPMRWVRVSAETEGRIVARRKEENDEAKRGEIVLELDPTLKAAALKIARARLLDAQARHELAALELARAEKLATRDVSSERDLDVARAEERSAWAAVLMAQGEVDTRTFELEKATIKAPIDGVIGRLPVEQDEYVVPGAFVFSIMEVRRVKIESFVPAAVARRLRAGEEVDIAVDGLQAVATIRSVAPGTDNESRTFKVILTAANKPYAAGAGLLLRPGTTVHWRRRKPS